MLNHYIPDGRPLQPGLRGPLDRRRDRAVAAARRRAGRGRRRRGPARRRRSAGRSAERDRDAARFGRLLVTGGAGFIGSCYVRDVLGRRDGTRITVLDKLTYAGNEANLAPVRDDPEHGGAVRASSAATSPTRTSSGRSSPTPTRSSTSPPSRTSTARSSTRRRSCGPASSASTCCSRPAGRRRAGRASSRSRPTRSTARSTRATSPRTTPLAPRSPYAAAKAAGELLVRSYVVTHGARRRRHPRLEHLRPVPPPREAHPAVRHQRPRRPAAAAVRRRPAAPRLAVRRRPRRGDRLRAAPRRDRRDLQRRRAATERTNREVVGAAARAPRQAVVARPARRGPARATTGATRWTARSSRRSAGGRGRRSRTGLAATVDWYRRQRGVVARRPDRATGTPTTSASTAAPGDRRRRPRPRPTDARRRHRRRRAARAAPGRRPRRCAVHRARPGRSPGPRATFDLDAPDGDRRACSTATGPRSSSTPRPGPTSTAAPATRTSRSRRNGDGDRRPRRGLRRARRSTSSSSRPTRSSTATRTDGTAYEPDDPTAPGNPYGASKARGRARWPTEAFAARPGRGARDRPDGLAVRAAGQRLPEQDPRRRRAGARPPASRCASSATSGARRPTPPTSPTRSSSCSPRTRTAGIHHLVNGLFASRADWARVRRRPGRPRRRGRGGPGRRPGRAPSTPPRWGVLAATPLPSGEPLRPWPDAMADYAPALLRARRRPRAR